MSLPFARIFFDANQHKLRTAYKMLTEENKAHRLTPETARAGYLLAHVAEAQLFFASMVFGTKIEFAPQTSGGGDKNEPIDLAHIGTLLDLGATRIGELVDATTEEEWQGEVSSERLGTRSRILWLAALMNHSVHHIGQAELTMKRGKVFAA